MIQLQEKHYKNPGDYSHYIIYYEVFLDDEMLYESRNEKEAKLFYAELKLKEKFIKRLEKNLTPELPDYICKDCEGTGVIVKREIVSEHVCESCKGSGRK